MVEHEICKGCQWNHYPLCYGTKMYDGKYMNIENLKPLFKCGQKDEDTMTDFSIKPQTKLEDLETRLKVLEDAKG